MKRKHKRLTFVLISLLLLGTGAALVLTAFEDNIVYFYSPTELKNQNIPLDKKLRIGGLVQLGSIKMKNGGTVAFTVTDTNKAIEVNYKGILPDLFREGQGVVAEGYLQGTVFKANEVLAKHDENYMPPEVAEALNKSETWKPDGMRK